MNKKNISITIVITLAVVIGMYFLSNVGREELDQKTRQLETFAACITDSGATFYGAFWCSHCQNQKKAFGNASGFLPYIECSTPDNKQTAECAEAKIEGYPTWEFANGERLSGELPFETLAEKTGCALPVLP